MPTNPGILFINNITPVPDTWFNAVNNAVYNFVYPNISNTASAGYVLTYTSSTTPPTWQVATGGVSSVLGTTNQIDVSTVGGVSTVSIDSAYPATLTLSNSQITGLGTLSTQNGTFSGTFSGTSSGTNTGDQTISLTGDVTGSGTGSFAATIAAAAVTYAKMQNVSNSSKLLGSGASGAGASPVELSLGTNLSITGTTLNATGSSFTYGVDPATATFSGAI